MDLLTALHRHPLEALVAGVLGLGADEAVAVEVLEDVRGPARRARDGEDGREQVRRDAEAVVDGGGIEVHVGVEVLLLLHQLGDALAHVDPLGLAQLIGELLRHALEVRRARVERGVHTVADAHDAAFVGQAILDVRVDLVDLANLVEHLDDALVGAAVQRALERADGAGDGAVHIAERCDGHAAAEGAGVKAVVGVQDVANVDGALHVGAGLFAVDEPQEVGRLAQLGIAREDLLAQTVAVKGRDEHRHLRDEVQALGARAVEVVAGLGIVIVATQCADGGAQRVHRLRVGREALDQLDHARGDFAPRGEVLLQRRQFVGVGQPLVVKQVNDLLVRRVFREVVDVVAAVDQLADVAAHVAEVRVRRDYSGHAFVDLLGGFTHSHGDCPCVKLDKGRAI